MLAEELALVGIRIGVALGAGAAIGFERGFHGRPAGFRTHALVCLTSSLLMLVTVFQSSWMTEMPVDAIRTDPTRMAQGIMTGIGFLGAGVIFKEGASVRGLTTAATIWITSAIGILIGIGFYVPALAGVAATLLVLSGLRWMETRLPKTFHASLSVRFAREEALSETELRNEVARLHCAKLLAPADQRWRNSRISGNHPKQTQCQSGRSVFEATRDAAGHRIPDYADRRLMSVRRQKDLTSTSVRP